MSVLSGVNNPLLETSAFHSCSTVGLLTGRSVAKRRIWAGQSADQLVASLIGDRTPFRSLELGTSEPHDHLSRCDGEWQCVYGDHLSWVGPTRPNPKQTDPRLAFQRLFAAPGEAAGFARAQSRRRSLLDFVLGEASSLHRQLGGADRARMDEYLTAVREVERQVQGLAGRRFDPGTETPDAAVDLERRFDAMIDIAALAFRADLTRVVTLMHGHALYSEFYEFLGLSRSMGGHHGISHHGGEPARLELLSVIGQWEMRRFARLLERLSVPEGDGTVLDHSLVLFMSDLLDGDAHSTNNLPLLLAGRGGGAIRTGQHLRFQDAVLPDLHLTMFRSVGIEATSFGDVGRQPLSDLLV